MGGPYQFYWVDGKNFAETVKCKVSIALEVARKALADGNVEVGG
jgi:hypothetical protein